MRKTITICLILIVLLAAGVLVVRFFGGKDEDVWVCENGQWVKHGHPETSMPEEECREEGQVSGEQTEVKEAAFDQASFEKNKEAAQKEAGNAPTYKFDGADLKYESYQLLTCPDCWEFTFSFSSRHAGYGDRQDEILAQVVTPHTIRVTTQNEKVSSVVTDRTFDELNERFLK